MKLIEKSILDIEILEREKMENNERRQSHEDLDLNNWREKLKVIFVL